MKSDTGYAEVCVNSPLSQRRTFSYSIPPDLKIEVGQGVFVPFGARLLQGIVARLADRPAVAETKDIAGVIEARPILSRARVELALWLSEYYLSPLFDAFALMLPPGFERKAQTFLTATVPAGFDLSRLSAEQRRALDLVQERSRPVVMNTIERNLGKKKAQYLVGQLARRGLVARSYQLEPIKVKTKTGLYLSLAVSKDKARQEAEDLRKKHAIKQAALLEVLARQSQPVTLSEVRSEVNCTRTIADVLVKKGLVAIEEREVRRDPLSDRNVALSLPLPLTTAQESAFEAIRSSLRKGSAEVFLLHGVTGSGKTEVYLHALAETVKLGKKGIVLVPEIALTPQTIERFSSRFPGRVAVIHSQLSLGEQFDEWQRIRNGEFDVVIGPRSALFAPQPDLGLIVIDEEHEWNYKQPDQSPYYHARDAAIKLAELTDAVVVLGSATPDVETYHHAHNGDYRVVHLPERLGPSTLPGVEIVDMRDELKAGNRSLFSRALTQAIAAALADGGQVILFLNRRGTSTFIQCRQCGFVMRCRRCNVPLTYHATENALLCHQCNYRIRAVGTCPRCRSPRIKFLGTGTEKLEEETALAFPQARLLRWDSDTTRQRHSHETILESFRRHEADILIGTQMVSKGLDLPQVTLVGVINADTGLNLPDFRAGERTYQLLSQVAGRAGRGPMGGRVIIQTYSPEHYAVQAAAKHDYALFYEKEIQFRQHFREPPFTRLARLTYSHTNNSRCRAEAERTKRVLMEEVEAKGIGGLDVLGPAPAFISRRRGRYRWQLMLRGANPSTLLSALPIPPGWVVDIDPVGLS